MRGGGGVGWWRSFPLAGRRLEESDRRARARAANTQMFAMCATRSVQLLTSGNQPVQLLQKKEKKKTNRSRLMNMCHVSTPFIGGAMTIFLLWCL